ncbi:ABC transporter ATP-binding protein [Corynebacterium freiburgense]|uniref:ABC transporter ATP-binding protein n=1 Tax=Corynebacterium freiburgense TaxID=556548 RepID=UPI00040A76D4|nr:ABC transporter ATP-binding protein [Corynebacterium freiburgense]WJZ02722.1 Iron import ATP-binding/permease protein IrtB [Corynebacterium freiburgense]
MLKNIYAISGGSSTFWNYVALTVISAVLQACAVLTLFPLLGYTFGPNPGNAMWWVLLFLALIISVWFMDIASAKKGSELGVFVMRIIHQRMPEAVLTWPDETLNQKRIASLRTLVSSRAVEATSSIILMVTPIITAVVFIFALGIGLLWISPPVAVVTVFGGIAALIALWSGMKIETRSEQEFSHAVEEMDTRLFEYAWAQPSLRTARSTKIGQKFVTDAIKNSKARVFKLLLWQIPGQFLFSLVLQIVLLGFGVAAWAAYENGSLDAVSAAVLVIILLRVVEHVTTIAGSIAGVVGIERTLQEVRRVIDTPAVSPVQPLASAPYVTAKELCVTYPDGTHGLIDVDLQLRPGTVTVIIGRSGSGKTTLVKALAGLLPFTSGSMSLHETGEPIASTGDLRGNSTVVFQQTVLGEGTLRDNIAAIDPDITQQRLDELADIAQLTPMIERSSQGWDTPVGELGAQLSGGERQRMGIARALAKPARFLLIDEATSALDTKNERALVQSIDRIREHYTTVIVTHRPATLAIADVVLVMKDGRVAEYGMPAELEVAGGEYARILQEWRQSASWSVPTGSTPALPT